MEIKSVDQIVSSLFFPRPSLLCIAVLVSSLALTILLSYGFSPFTLTISVLIISTMLLFTFAKKRLIFAENPVQDEDVTKEHKNLQKMGSGRKPELEIEAQNKATQQSEVGLVHNYQAGLLDFLSESEISDDLTSDDFELNCVAVEEVNQSPVTSNGSASEDDDDSLIEIALPGSHSVDSKEEPKQRSQPNSLDILPDSIFQQEGLMELLAEINEMNEEENLIEIDISMGSI